VIGKALKEVVEKRRTAVENSRENLTNLVRSPQQKARIRALDIDRLLYRTDDEIIEKAFHALYPECGAK
jgi:hypothetical protein